MHHQLLFHCAKNHAPDYGSPDGSNPTDYRHQQDGDAGLEGKYVSGIKERGAPRVDASGNARQTSGNGVDPKLGGIRIHQYRSWICVHAECWPWRLLRYGQVHAQEPKDYGIS